MRILYTLIFACLIVVSAFVFNQINSFQSPAFECEDVSKDVLDNGLAVIIKSSHKVPLVAIRLVVKTGSATEGRFSGAGVSHFVEHMLFKGTAENGVGEIEKKIKSYGGYINAVTSHDTTEVHLLIKSNYLDEALALLSDFVYNSAFKESEYQKERDVILNEIRMGRDEPSRRVSMLLWSSAYLVHPYRYPVIGYEDLFKQLKRDDLVEYHKARYIPNNSVLSIVGDVEREAALKSVTELFGKLPRGMDIQPVNAIEPLQASQRCAEEGLEGLKVSRLLIAFHTTSVFNKNMYPLDALAAALGDGESSRLYKRLVKDKGLVYSVSAHNYTPRDPGLFIIQADLDEEKIDETIAEILSEIERIKITSISRSELNKIKRTLISGYIYGQESIWAQADDYASSYALTGDYNFSRRYLKGIAAVRTRDIAKAALEYLNADNMTIAIVNPKKSTSVNTVSVPKPAKEFDIKKTLMPNGLTLLTYEDHSLPVVSINVVFKGGVRSEDVATNGISYLTSEMLLKGAGFHSADWIAKETASRGIILGTSSGKNSFGLSVKCLKGDLDFCLGLISDILNRPTFPENEMKILKEIQLAAIRDADDDIFAVASKTLRRTLYKVHPYRMDDLGTLESVKSLKRQDLLNYYRRFVSADNAVVAVFGDIGSSEMGKITKTFSGLRRGDRQEINPPSEPQQSGARQAMKQMPKEQTVLLIGYPGVDVENPDKYALGIIDSILTSQGGRLYMDIREKFGFSYTLGSVSVLGLEPGYFVFYVATTEENVEAVKKLILNQIKLLKVEGPTQEEMALAKDDLLGGYFRSLEINSIVAYEAALDELYGLGYRHMFDFPDKINAVTAQDVMRVAEKYFTDTKSNVVIVSPAPSPKPSLERDKVK